MKNLNLFLTLLFFCAINLVQAQDIAQDLQTVFSHEHNHYHFHSVEDYHLLDYELDAENNLQLYFELENADGVTVDGHDHLMESCSPLITKYNLNKVELFYKSETNNAYRLIEKDFEKVELPVYKMEKNKDLKSYKYISNKKRKLLKNPPTSSQPNATGSLSGKTVWLSPGHGWQDTNGDNGYLTQRGNTNGIVEDFGSIESIDYYLQRYLENAGANVWVVRERDVNPNEVIVDNDGAGYSETGAWTTSGSTGYNGGTYRYLFSSATETGTANFTPTIPAAGWYWVSTYYKEGGNRPIDTRYRVHHAGGTTEVSINQEIHGETWVYLGEFYFDAGSTGFVELTNQSSDVGEAVISDAVRFGGGMGTELDCAGSSAPSGRPRFEEAARLYAPYQGYNVCEGDPNIRPHYAEWELSKGSAIEQSNAIYVAWHTNAFDGTARGTVTYSYNGLGSNPVITPNSADLATFIHNEMINDIHLGWDPTWQDRGTNTANFAEVRELTTMPGCLLEVLFHDNAADATAYKQPEFRQIVARAAYQGIVKFFNWRDGSPVDLLPEPPTHVMAENTNTGEITVSWDPPAATTIGGDAQNSYMLYVGTHGKAFGDGIPLTGTTYTFTGAQPSTTYYFRVASVNSGGESFTTTTVAARTPPQGFKAHYLLVDGFDRIDRSASIKQYESAALGTCERIFPDRMNRYDYMVDHAKSFSSCDVSFDGTSNEALISGYLTLNKYEGVDWILGEESTVDFTLNPTEQSLLTTYLNNGGNLIISGAEIGWDIGRSSSPNASVSFYNNYLKATYVGDDGGSYNFTGTANPLFSGISGTFDDSNNGYYDVEYPDRLGASGGSSVVLNYSGGTGDGAAVAYKGTDFGVVHFGFPLETVYNSAVRDNIICDAIQYLTPSVNCPQNIYIPTTYNTGIVDYQIVEQVITADNLVDLGTDITYDAGVCIDLQPDFEVKLGAIFHAFINGCTPGYPFREAPQGEKEESKEQDEEVEDNSGSN